LNHFLKVVVIAQLVVECPDVASIEDYIRITAWTVRMMAVVEAGLVPANVNERAVAI